MLGFIVQGILADCSNCPERVKKIVMGLLEGALRRANGAKPVDFAAYQKKLKTILEEGTIQ